MHASPQYLSNLFGAAKHANIIARIASGSDILIAWSSLYHQICAWALEVILKHRQIAIGCFPIHILKVKRAAAMKNSCIVDMSFVVAHPKNTLWA